MIRILALVLCLLMLSAAGPALAQNRGQPALFEMLAQLQSNPAYAGRIVGTHIVHSPAGDGRFLYEVRIVSPNDRIIIVYLDPTSGRVVANPDAWFANR